MPQADAKDHFTEESGRSSLWLAAISWSFSILYMFFIFSLSGRPHPPAASSFIDRWNFLLHLLAYCPLGFLFGWSLDSSGVRRRIVFYGCLLGLAYAISDELHQSFVPGRGASLRDVIADGIGSFLGSYAFRAVASANRLVRRGWVRRLIDASS